MQMPRHDRRYLYKYRSVDAAERILREHSVWCSHPSGFNDLLDTQVDLRLPPVDAKFRVELTREYVRLILAESPPVLTGMGRVLVSLFRAQGPVASREQLEADVREAVSSLDSNLRQYEARVGAAIRASSKGPQILCLSENPGSLPMWYHYADKYKGVVVAFDCQTDPQTLFSVAQPVKYGRSVPYVCERDEWIRVLTGQQAQPSGVLERLAMSKSDQWIYEQEWRLPAGIGPPGSGRALPLVPEEFGGLILGKDMPAADAQRLIGLARAWRPDCRIWRARLDYSTYGFVIGEEPGLTSARTSSPPSDAGVR